MPLAHFSFNEAILFDLWTLVHILSGVSVGYFLYWIKLNPRTASRLALALFSLWEIAEFVAGVKENPANIILDIVVAYVAFRFTSKVLVSRSKLIAVLVITANALLSLAGWIAYLQS